MISFHEYFIHTHIYVKLPRWEFVEITDIINNLQLEIDLIFLDRNRQNSICDCKFALATNVYIIETLYLPNTYHFRLAFLSSIRIPNMIRSLAILI